MLKNNVLRKNGDFQSVYNRGKSYGDRYIVLFYKKNNLSHNRTGFLASKKVGNSVQRNRARRLMRESYRQLEESISNGYDLIIIARQSINGKKCQDVGASLQHAFVKTGVIRRDEKSEKSN